MQAALDARHAQRRFVGLGLGHRKHAAPDARRAIAFDLEQIDPLVGIGEVIARAIAASGRAEIEAGGDLDEAFWPGEASKAIPASGRTVLLPPSAPIRYLPRSFSVSPAALMTVASTWSAVCARSTSLVEKRTSPQAARLDMGQRGVHELVLLPLHDIGISHFAFEQADIEHRDQLAAAAVAKMKQRRRHAARRACRKHLAFETERDQHFHRRRMDGGGALVLRGVRQLLDQRDRNAFPDQSQRHHRAHRPAAGNDHAVVALCHLAHLYFRNLECRGMEQFLDLDFAVGETLLVDILGQSFDLRQGFPAMPYFQKSSPMMALVSLVSASSHGSVTVSALTSRRSIIASALASQNAL